MTAISQRFAGKTVAITGAAHGIGAATVERFLAEGARVAVIDREEFADAFARTKQPRRLLVGGRRLHRCGDASEFHARTVAALGPVDILFNNVGQSGRERAAPFHESRTKRSGASCSRSRSSPRCGCRGWSCLPCASGAGASSTCPVTQLSSAMPGLPTTPLRRWALSGSPAALARELAPHGVTVNAVAPGAIRTRAHDRLTPVRDRAHQVHDAGRLHRRAGGCRRLLSRSSPATTPATSPARRLLIDGGRWMI